MPGLSSIFGGDTSSSETGNDPAVGISAPDPVDNDLDTDGDDNTASANGGNDGGIDGEDTGLTVTDPQPQPDPGFDV